MSKKRIFLEAFEVITLALLLSSITFNWNPVIQYSMACTTALVWGSIGIIKGRDIGRRL